MQAPLSSTASGQQPPLRPPSGLSSSTPPLGLRRALAPGCEQHGDIPAPRRLQAWSPVAAPGLPADRPGVADGAGLAHDAGNLLGALRLYCDLLARPGVLREEHRHYAAELQLLSERSRTLVERLLHPGATAAGRKDGAAPCVSVPLVIEQCRGLLSAVAHRAVEVVYAAGADAPVRVSRESVERILVNLTKNAAEASAPGGAITLRVTRLREGERSSRAGRRSGPSRIVLSIEDHGRGMSVAAVKVLLAGGHPGPAAAVTEQPQQLHGLGLVPGLVPGKRPGRGLGFRVVRELVEASGGELRLKSQSGCGTTVEIAWAVAGEQAGSALENQDGGRQTAAVYKADGTKGRV